MSRPASVRVASVWLNSALPEGQWLVSLRPDVADALAVDVEQGFDRATLAMAYLGQVVDWVDDQGLPSDE